MKTMLRSTRNGQIFPMNENLARHDAVEIVKVDDDGNVVEPEEVGPAVAAAPEISTASDESAAKTRTRRRKTEGTDE